MDGNVHWHNSTERTAGVESGPDVFSWTQRGATVKKDTRNAATDRTGDPTDISHRKYASVDRKSDDSRDTSRAGGWYNVTAQVRDHVAYLLVGERVVTRSSPYFHPAGGRAGLIVVRRQVDTYDTYFKAPIFTTAAMNYGRLSHVNFLHNTALAQTHHFGCNDFKM